MKARCTFGLDLGKNTIQIHGIDRKGKLLVNKPMKRNRVLVYFSNLEPSLIGIEACGGAHYWARELKLLGHTVKLMPPQYVKPYVKTNKNDAADAEAVCEAVSRPTMRFVNIKTEEQQAILLIHREREGVVKERTALINRVRGTLSEFGIIAPSGPGRLHRWLEQAYYEYEDKLPGLLVNHINRMIERLHGLEESIRVLDSDIDQHRATDEACKRLVEVPGIGRITASALTATIGDGRSFSSGRQFAAWLGLVPRQHSTGGKQRLLGISKRGDGYLRRMFIHGARAVVRHMNPNRSVTVWLRQLSNRSHKNVVIVALANKLARIAWAMLASGQKYKEISV